MIMSFEEANRAIKDALDEKDWDAYSKAYDKFSPVFQSICSACINRFDCRMRTNGIAECNYFNRGE